MRTMKKLLLITLLLTSILSIAQIGIRSKNELLTVYVDSITSSSIDNDLRISLYSLEGKKIKEAVVSYTDIINGRKTFELRVSEQPKGVFIINVLVDDKLFKKLYINQ